MDYFLLDSKTGELRTAKPLDKEALPDATGLVILTVRARELVDGVLGNDPLTVATTQASVTIKDVNDSPPTFNQIGYSVSLVENTPIGTPLPLDISVHDPDVGQNSIFSLKLEDVSGVFDIEPKLVTGSSQVSIRVANGTLDYENPNQRKFIVLLIAEETETNPKLSSTATLTVSITDANDNRPVFDQESYTTTISETANPGQLITTITAKDIDSGMFGEQGIRYSLSGTGAELFNVDPVTGAITVAKCPSDNFTRKKRLIPDENFNKSDDFDDMDMPYFSTPHDDLSVDTKDMLHNGQLVTYQIHDNHHDLIDEINNAGDESVVTSDHVDVKQLTTTNIPHEFESPNHISKEFAEPGKAPCLDYETQSVYFLSYKVCK